MTPDTPAALDALQIDPASDRPPFEQVRVGIIELIESGELLSGERLPTVRALASRLGVAANTVARSYRELEAAGVDVAQMRRDMEDPAIEAQLEDVYRLGRMLGADGTPFFIVDGTPIPGANMDALNSALEDALEG